jgi:MFS family permease
LSIGPAFGPFMGGNLLAFASWRVVYGITLPLCGLGLILAWWLLPNLRRPERRRLDYYGALTTTVVISTLLLALSQGNREGWHSQYILTLFAIAGGAAVVWVVVELWFNALVAIFCLFPALPFWRLRKYQAPSTSHTATVSVQSAAVSKGDPKS